MAVQINDGLHTKSHNKHKPLRCYGYIRSLSTADSHLTHSKHLKLISHLVMVLGLFIVLLGFRLISDNKQSISRVVVDPINMEFLPLLLHDLKMEGILKHGHKGLLLSNDDAEAIHTSLFLRKSDMEFLSIKDSERQSAIPDESFDLTFTKNFQATSEFIDRILKVGGIVAIELNGVPSLSFDKPSNYKVVYFRKFQSNIVVMRKSEDENSISFSTQKRLLGYTPEEKKTALTKLEDVLLEPPRSSSMRSKAYQKKYKYLPDLLGDSLENYRRRVFVDAPGLLEKDGGSGTTTSWFANNYPTRNQKFEIYEIKASTSSRASYNELVEIVMSNWLKINVKEEDFVVMKADADVAEGLIRNKVTSLVDELFLECKPQGKGVGGRKNMHKRAYWECVSLYGMLKDKGVAVHQWWG